MIPTILYKEKRSRIILIQIFSRIDYSNQNYGDLNQSSYGD